MCRISRRTVTHAITKTRFLQSFTRVLISGNGTVCIPAGSSRYPFRIQIPFNIPCSFEHKYGHIRYTIKAIIGRPWRFDHECKAAFTVIAIYDLNGRRERCVSVRHDISVKCTFPFRRSSFTQSSRLNYNNRISTFEFNPESGKARARSQQAIPS